MHNEQGLPEIQKFRVGSWPVRVFRKLALEKLANQQYKGILTLLLSFNPEEQRQPSLWYRVVVQIAS